MKKMTGRRRAWSVLEYARVFQAAALVIGPAAVPLYAAALPVEGEVNGAAVPSPDVRSADQLPLKEVVLFTSGVGYFQRTGSINGAAAIPLTFRTSHVDDILKSLILIDPEGQVQPATYSSQEPVDKVLHSFGLDVSQNLSMVDLLQQLRGVQVQVVKEGLNPETITGQVLSVETHQVHHKDGEGTTAMEEVSTLNLVTDAGIRSVPLSQVTQLHILDPVLAQQLKEALSVLSAGHNTEQRTVTLHFGTGPARQVEAGYVTEAPVWKTSYRLSLENVQKPYMQGWALVDNPTDQDWDHVRLTLVSGQPISFIQDLYTPLYIPRPVVPPEVQANPYPQLSEENVLQNARKSLGAQHRDEKAPAAPASETAAPPPPPAEALAPMAAPAKSTPGSSLGDIALSGVASAAVGKRAGELFQYRIQIPVTVPRQQSAMIPIVSDVVKAEKVDLYNPDVNLENPENAVELINSTGLHLKAGPITVFDEGGYAGDARMPEIEPGDTQLVTYAVDLGITGLKENKDNISHLVSISIKHGVLNLTSRNQVTTDYTLKSKLDKMRTVLVEQPIKEGWKLLKPAKPDQKTRTFYRFRVPVPGGSSTPFSVMEEQLMTQTTGITDTDLSTLLEYRRNSAASPGVQAALTEVIQRSQKVAQINNQLTGQKARMQTISTEQARIRQNMDRLDHESALYKRYVAELDEQETQLSRIRTEIDHLQTTLTQAQAELSSFVDKMDVE